MEATEKFVVATTIIRDGSKRGASQTLEEILEEEKDFKSSGTKEEELVPERKLTKKEPTFTQALQAKRAKITLKNPATRISIRDLAPKATLTKIIAKARLSKGKNFTAKTMHLEDPEYDHMMAIVAEK